MEGSFVDFSEDLGVLEEEVLVVTDFYGVAAPAWEKNAVASLDGGRDDFALGVGSARTNGYDGCLGQWGRGGRGWKENAGRGFGVRLEALDEDAVEEGDDGADGLDGERHGRWWGE